MNSVNLLEETISCEHLTEEKMCINCCHQLANYRRGPTWETHLYFLLGRETLLDYYFILFFFLQPHLYVPFKLLTHRPVQRPLPLRCLQSFRHSPTNQRQTESRSWGKLKCEGRVCKKVANSMRLNTNKVFICYMNRADTKIASSNFRVVISNQWLLWWTKFTNFIYRL